MSNVDDNEAALTRIEQLLTVAEPYPQTDHADDAEVLAGVRSLYHRFYTRDSPQLRMLEVLNVAKAAGLLRNLAGEIRLGLVDSLRGRIIGEVSSDSLQLSRQLLNDGNVNTAAVLVAASFEETLRRMGSEFAEVAGRPKLADVITALKDHELLRGAEVGSAQSYLQFRNHALHAEWDKIEKSVVVAVLAFVEQLLIRHFS